MDLTNMIIDVQVKNAYSRGGIPLNIQGFANIKVPGEEPLLNNTLERFLGRGRDHIMKTARETLEGNLRGVLSTMTPEQVNTDKETFAQRLTAEAEHDLSKLGLVLDTLKIQNVSDEVGYLDAMGRQRSAAIRRDALKAEAVNQAESAEARWSNTKNAEVATLDSQMKIAGQENDRRVADAKSRRGALIAQQQAEVQALIAQARGELGTQEARIEQVRRQLHADILQPAEAPPQGRGGGQGRRLHGHRAGQGHRRRAHPHRRHLPARRRRQPRRAPHAEARPAVPAARRHHRRAPHRPPHRPPVRQRSESGGNLGARIVDANEQIKAATGVDFTRTLRDKFGEEHHTPPPRPPIKPPAHR
jgi:flotillin